AEGRIEHPPPDDAGHDQRHRQRIEEHGAEEALAALLALDHGGEDEAEDDGERTADGEDDQVAEGRAPLAGAEQALVVAPPLRVDDIFGEAARARERLENGPADGPGKGHRRDRDRRTERDDWR